jgi:uncharacterized protein (TIGR02466 family)
MTEPLVEFRPFTTALFVSPNLPVPKSVLPGALALRSRDSGNLISNIGGWQSSSYAPSQNAFMADVEAMMTKTATQVHRQLGISAPAKLFEYWVNINGRNDYNLSHTHYGATVSAVLYLKAPKNSGAIVFERPDVLNDYVQPDELNDLNFGTYAFEPEENMAVFFPGFLKHYVKRSEANEPRVSIAFNFRKG